MVAAALSLGSMTSGSIISGMPYFSQAARDAAMFCDALPEQVRLVRQHEEVHHHAGRVHLAARR